MPKKKAPRQRVKGHWVFPKPTKKNPSGKAYYVKGYLRKRPTEEVKRAAVAKRKRTIANKRRRFSEPQYTEEGFPLYWTWKVLAILPPGYIGKFVDQGQGVPTFLHTPFTSNRRDSVLELHRLVNRIETEYENVEWEWFRLYKVGGPGPVTVKHWYLVETVDDVENIPPLPKTR
jgi:hypothetical protein